MKRDAANALAAPADKRPGDETFAERLNSVWALFLKRRNDGGSSEQ